MNDGIEVCSRSLLLPCLQFGIRDRLEEGPSVVAKQG